MNGKYGDLINEARQQENESSDGKQPIKKDGNTERQINDISPKEKTEAPNIVTLNIKIERKYRQHWIGQAKLQGLTIKEVIVSHLTDRFGLPE